MAVKAREPGQVRKEAALSGHLQALRECRFGATGGSRGPGTDLDGGCTVIFCLWLPADAPCGWTTAFLATSKVRHVLVLEPSAIMFAMSALAHNLAAFELRSGREQSLSSRTGSVGYSLRATEDGWSLLAPSGDVVFRGLGLSSRRQCLEFAHQLGVLAVFS